MSQLSVDFFQSTKCIAGVDEVGRGPLAGDVVAAAVILYPHNPILGLMDSKKLSEKQRELLAKEIYLKAQSVSIGRASVAEIDQLNILQASLLAMKRAVDGLTIAPELCQIDGNKIPKGLPCVAEAIVKGDSKIEAISAASIIAKVQRDAEMIELDQLYPNYGFKRHKGYGTKEHLAALQKHGVIEQHRRSFAPIRRLIENELREPEDL